MKTKIQIKTFYGSLLFEFEKKNNSIKETVVEAVKNKANLQGANLQGAYLQGANLQGAYLQRAYLQRANLQGANLQEANLQGANLQRANLQGAYLQEANLWGAYLQEANLWGAYLQRANLQGANLQEANLQEANLHGANLQRAYLQRANLQGANLQEANLQKIKNLISILPDGELIIWKKLQNGRIAKLLIPTGAGRINAIGSRKCRFEFAKVIAIYDGKDEIKEGLGLYDGKTKYIVGKIIKPDSFDDSALIECSHGIHGFITRQEAENFNM
jgi:hypothetical protein